MEQEATKTDLNLEGIVKDVLSTIDREREQEIIARRFGLFDRRETLEQIGELLGITRERVRQLEKSVITKLKSAAHELPHIKKVEDNLSTHLKDMGKVARTSELTAKVKPKDPKLD